MADRSSLLGSGLAKDRIVLGDVSSPLGPSLFVLSHFFLLSVGLGLSMRWAEVVKFFDPTIFIIAEVSVLYRLNKIIKVL